MADYSVALGVKPLDVSTPLLAAARIRAAEAEQQQQQIKVQRDMIGAEARGLLPLYGKPEYEQARMASAERLKQAGIFNNPMAVQGWERDTSSPIALQSLVARSTPPELALRMEETKRAQANADRTFNEGVRQFNITSDRAENKSIPEQVKAREEAVRGQGLDPKDPQNRAYILSGRMPREDQQPLTATDKKAILEADELVLTNRSAIDALERAKGFSKEAYTGPFAGQRGYVASLFGSDAGTATENLQNEVTSNALAGLKAIFGAAPTEGERKILLEIQGSANKAPQVREDIYNRAQVLARKRLEFNERRAAELRGGTFYKPQGGAQPAAGKPQNDPPAISDAREAIAKGAPRAAVEKRLREMGVSFKSTDLDLN